MSTKITRFRNLLILALMCLISGSVWGQTEKNTLFDFAKCPKEASEIMIDDVTFLGEKGTNANTPARAWTDGLRIYDGNIITFSVPTDFLINKITFSSSINSNGTSITEWTGSSNSVVFNNLKKATIKTITVTYSSISSETQASTPTFTPESGTTFENNLTVALSTTTEGATIYYTTNGDVPTTNSTQYSTAFTINQTTTIKAIAIKEGLDDSKIAEATYTKVLPSPEFKYSSDNVSINLGETFTAPTLSYNGNSDLSGLTISYTSSDTNVATINAEGVVTLSTAGKTTITASVSATGDYEAAEATYTLTVIDPNAPTEIYSYDFAGKTLPICQADFTTSGNLYYESNTLRLGTGSGGGTITTKDAKLTGNIIVVINAKAYSSSYPGDLTVKVGNETKTVNIQSTALADYSISFSVGTTPSELTISTPSSSVRINLAHITVFQKKESAESNIDPTTGAMTLTGAWTTEAVKALEIPANVTSVDMTAINVDVLPTTIGNPNCLFYVKENSTLEDFNVIAGNSAIIGIELQDGYDFYNTKSFTGDINYSRTFASGWNTFALPFDAAIPNGVQVEAFDKKDGNQILFTEATSIEANTAYLINVQAGGEISFAANNVTVPVTATTGDTYKSNFLHMTGDDIAGKYILVMEEGVEVFARANAEAQMHAFRGYLDLPAASGAQYSISHDGGATGINNTDIEGIKIYSINGTLIINADKTQSVQIYGLDGRMVKNIQVSEGENTVTELAKGIYLINNQKAIIK